MFANVSGCAPVQVWHIAVTHGKVVLQLRGNVLVKHIVWQIDVEICGKLGCWMIQQNRSAVNPHVLSVRGRVMDRGDGSKGALAGCIGDGLRANWPVVVHVKS